MAKCSAHLFFVLLMVALDIAQLPLPLTFPLPRPPLNLPRLVVDPFVVAFYIIYACLIFCTFSLVFLCAGVCACAFVCVFVCLCECVCVWCVGLCVFRPLLAPSKYFNKFYNFLSEPKRVQPHRFIVAPSPATLSTLLHPTTHYPYHLHLATALGLGVLCPLSSSLVAASVERLPSIFVGHKLTRPLLA